MSLLRDSFSAGAHGYRGRFSRPGTAVIYIFHFPVGRVDFGLVSRDTGDSGLGISLVRLVKVPSGVRDGLMLADDGGLFRDWG